MWDGILNGCASVLYELAKLVGDWGLAIIIVTLIIRLLLFPLQGSSSSRVSKCNRYNQECRKFRRYMLVIR